MEIIILTIIGVETIGEEEGERMVHAPLAPKFYNDFRVKTKERW